MPSSKWPVPELADLFYGAALLLLGTAIVQVILSWQDVDRRVAPNVSSDFGNSEKLFMAWMCLPELGRKQECTREFVSWQESSLRFLQ
jgi:hypothetical protein